MKTKTAILLAAGALALPLSATAELVLYNGEGFHGRSLSITQNLGDLQAANFNDRASSAIVYGNRYEVCEHARFQGRCVVLRPGRYPSLAAMGLDDRISSVRMLSKMSAPPTNYAPPAYPVYDSRPRKNEKLFEARVVAVRAVYGAPQQRCWVEREQVVDNSSSAAGAVVGGILGGVIGHQIGSGRGNDVATAAGAAGGAALGYNIARDSSGNVVTTRDVQKCGRAPGSGKPEYWDVAYVFDGREHHIQTAYPPGPTVTVNKRGEPRA
jgi:uncharacterized protein YcfJ